MVVMDLNPASSAHAACKAAAVRSIDMLYKSRSESYIFSRLHWSPQARLTQTSASPFRNNLRWTLAVCSKPSVYCADGFSAFLLRPS